MRSKKNKELARVNSSITKEEVMKKLFDEYEGRFDEKTFTEELFILLQDTFEGEIVRFADSILIRFMNGKSFKITITENKD